MRPLATRSRTCDGKGMPRTSLRIAIALCVLTTAAPVALGQRGVPSARRSSYVSQPRSVSYGNPYYGSNYYRSRYRNHHDYTGSDWIFLTVAFLGIPAAVATSVGLYHLWRNRTVGWVRIVDTPRGEAPPEIREAWVGVDMPLRSWETEPGTVKSGSLLTPGGPVLDHGYAVAGRSAIRALGLRSPVAAAWWRTNAAYVLESGYRFVFPVEVCEPVKSIDDR
jgi:hypothetical protein